MLKAFIDLLPRGIPESSGQMSTGQVTKTAPICLEIGDPNRLYTLAFFGRGRAAIHVVGFF
jgi:hypothetical protein